MVVYRDSGHRPDVLVPLCQTADLLQVLLDSLGKRRHCHFYHRAILYLVQKRLQENLTASREYLLLLSLFKSNLRWINEYAIFLKPYELA